MAKSVSTAESVISDEERAKLFKRERKEKKTNWGPVIGTVNVWIIVAGFTIGPWLAVASGLIFLGMIFYVHFFRRCFRSSADEYDYEFEEEADSARRNRWLALGLVLAMLLFFAVVAGVYIFVTPPDSAW